MQIDDDARRGRRPRFAYLGRYAIVRRATAGIPAQLLGMAIRHVRPEWVDPITKTR